MHVHVKFVTPPLDGRISDCKRLDTNLLTSRERQAKLYSTFQTLSAKALLAAQQDFALELGHSYTVSTMHNRSAT